MGTRDDASLTAQERAALAHLEARADADDPQLAHRLKGRYRPQIDVRIPPLPMWTGSGWWSIPLIVVGLALAVLGLSTDLVVSVFGAVVMAGGLWMIAGFVDRRLTRPPTP